MNPHLTTSASPATRSAERQGGQQPRSQSTPTGSWKLPTRFLPSAVLMPVFPPTAASTMPEHGGRHVDQGHPAQPGRGDEPGQVGGRAAADPDHGVGSGEAGLTEHRPAAGGHVGRLGRLAIGNVDPHRLKPGLGQPADHPLARSIMVGGWITATRCTVPGEQARQPASSPVPDQHRVRPLGPDLDPGRLSHGAATIRSATSVRRQVVGVDHLGRHLGVQRRPLVEQGEQPAADVAQQQRPGGVQPDPLDGRGQADPQPDHPPARAAPSGSARDSTAPPPSASTPGRSSSSAVACSSSARKASSPSSAKISAIGLPDPVHDHRVDVGELAARAARRGRPRPWILPDPGAPTSTICSRSASFSITVRPSLPRRTSPARRSAYQDELFSIRLYLIALHSEVTSLYVDRNPHLRPAPGDRAPVRDRSRPLLRRNRPHHPHALICSGCFTSARPLHPAGSRGVVVGQSSQRHGTCRCACCGRLRRAPAAPERSARHLGHADRARQRDDGRKWLATGADRGSAPRRRRPRTGWTSWTAIWAGSPNGCTGWSMHRAALGRPA